MKTYSVHLCGDESKKQECEDIEVTAETENMALTYALIRYPEFKGECVTLKEKAK